MLHDIQYALRSLVRNKAFTVSALCAVAVGIGATTAIFSIVNATILRPLPFASPDRLVQLYGTPAERGEAIASADVEEIRTTSTSFEAIAGYGVGARYLQTVDGLERVMTVDVERDFFSLLGAQPVAGRTFQRDDPSNVAVASESFWRQRLGADSSAVGRPVMLNGSSSTIIGVMGDSFQFPYGAASLLQGVDSQARTDLWILREPPPGQPRGRLALVTGRLKANVSLTTAQSELAVIMQRLEAQSPDRIKGLGVRLVQLSEAIVAPPVRRSLYILFGAACLVLLLACANVTNLLLVRAMMRGKEVGARIALGASPLRLVRQFLTESLLVSLIGGAGGVWLAWWGTGQFMRIAAAHLPRSREVGMDWQVLALSIGLCLMSGLAFGLAQLFNVLRNDAQSILREAIGHHTMNIRQRRLRDGLVAAEVALAFVLAVGATLLVRELVRLRDTEIGIVTENVLTFHIGQQMTQGMDGRQFYEIAERVRQLPGVLEAGFTQLLPLQSWGWRGNSYDFRVRGSAPTDTSPFLIELRYVTPRYFHALGIPIKRGRAFTDSDNRDAPAVILINETLARMSFGGEDPVGKTTTRGTIIGIAGDVRQVNLDRQALPEIYYPIAQNWSQVGELGMSLIVRTNGAQQGLTDAIRTRIREVNPNVAIFDIKTMDRVVADSMSDFFLYMTLMFVFASVAFFLALTGTYGVISYIAASRTREFAIRAALGAGRAQVAWLVLAYAVRLTSIGLACGFTVVLIASRLLHNLPVSVRPPDGSTIVPVASLIALAAVTACLVPARRAAVADLMSTLRDE